MNEIQFILYSLPDEDGKVQVVVRDETLWCTQKAMAQLFGVGVPAISKHLGHIFEEGELMKEVVVSKMEITTNEALLDNDSVAEKCSVTAFEGKNIIKYIYDSTIPIQRIHLAREYYQAGTEDFVC